MSLAMANSYCHMFTILSAQIAHAFLCLGKWSCLRLVKDPDVNKVAVLPPGVEKDGYKDGDIEMEDGWDAIIL